MKTQLSYRQTWSTCLPQDRSCTDVLCLGLLLAFLAVWGLIAVWAVMHGDPSKGRPHSQCSKCLEMFFVLSPTSILCELTWLQRARNLSNVIQRSVDLPAADVPHGLVREHLRAGRVLRQAAPHVLRPHQVRFPHGAGGLPHPAGLRQCPRHSYTIYTISTQHLLNIYTISTLNLHAAGLRGGVSPAQLQSLAGGPGGCAGRAVWILMVLS